MIQTKEGNVFCYMGSKGGQREVDFIISKKIREKIKAFEGINYRIAMLKLELNNNNSLTIIQVYAPTTVSEESINDNFYNEISEYIEN